jgi:hypothetical protein
MQAIAIIIAGALIAAAIALTNHWTIHPAVPGTVLLLNRWTGTVVFCTGIQPSFAGFVICSPVVPPKAP